VTPVKRGRGRKRGRGKGREAPIYIPGYATASVSVRMVQGCALSLEESRSGAPVGGRGRSPPVAETFPHIYGHILPWKDMAPLKLFQFRELKAVVYAIQQLLLRLLKNKHTNVKALMNTTPCSEKQW